MKKLLRTIVAGIICLSLLNGRAGTVLDLLKSGATVRNAVFPFYSQPDRNLSTVVHVERAYLDYQRKGFFRIGILPVGALEGVTIEVRDPRSASDTFLQIQRWFGVGDHRATELRQVKFLYSTNVLEAGRVQCGADNQWELSDGVRLISGAVETRARRATLQISGQDAGQVVLENAAKVSNMFRGLRPGSER